MTDSGIVGFGYRAKQSTKSVIDIRDIASRSSGDEAKRLRDAANHILADAEGLVLEALEYPTNTLSDLKAKAAILRFSLLGDEGGSVFCSDDLKLLNAILDAIEALE